MQWVKISTIGFSIFLSETFGANPFVGYSDCFLTFLLLSLYPEIEVTGRHTILAKFGALRVGFLPLIRDFYV